LFLSFFQPGKKAKGFIHPFLNQGPGTLDVGPGLKILQHCQIGENVPSLRDKDEAQSDNAVHGQTVDPLALEGEKFPRLTIFTKNLRNGFFFQE
jgi:hypothetical protein